ncbi:ribonuclease H-like domain-containing protein [Tanacetum coccineum]
MTYTDKELDNVLDISYLKIKVGHSNRTAAYISKIGNLILSNGLPLYDVMVIPEYCITLISVHKLIKENKVIVAFDDNRCYFLNQDLNLKNVLGIGEQCEGLYYYNDKGIKSNSSTLRFQCMHLADWHTGLVHLQTHGPYKVTSSEGFRFFLTVVDDYTKAVWLYLIKSKDEISNDDERVANDLNKGKSESSSSSVSGSNINTTDFPVDSRNDADSSDGLVATQNEEVATLEENVFMRIIWIKIQAHLKVFKMLEEMNALLRNGTWELVDLPEGRKAIGSKWIYKIKFRCLLNIDVSMSWHVFQLDVNNAFLYGNLEVVSFMKPLEGYFPSNNKSGKGVFLALLVYVDDIIITSNSVSEIKKFKVFFKSKFMIKDLGKLIYFLGIEVVDTNKGICLNQRKYVLDLLSEYGMLACKPAKTPLMSKLVISNEASDKDPLLENITDYQKLMGKLIYLTNTRLDISYLKIAFKILRYLKSCPGLGIHITKTSGMFLTAYSDVDWAKCIVTRKSVSGYYVFLSNSFVSWKNLHIENLFPVSLHCDNNSAIKIAANPVFHERTKHLEIDLHFVREKVLKGVFKTVNVDSANQTVDIFTKGLDTVQHLKLVKRLGLIDVYQVETKG